MAPQKEPNPAQEHPEDVPPDLPVEEHPESYIRSTRGTATDVDGRPDLLRMEFAGPDSLIDPEDVKAQRAIRYVDLTLVPDASLLEMWEDLDPTEQRMYRAAILQELFDDSYEELETRLKSSGVVAREVGFVPGDIPSDTTLWRGICDIDEDMIKEAARRANNAVLHARLPGGSSLSDVSTDPGKPQFYYEITKYDREISTDQKMQKLTRVVAEYMELAIPHIDFGRDPSAPNYQYPPESFYRLLAHTALEDCYPEKGAELFRWLSGDDVDVPGASTLYRYAEQFDVDEHAERFLDATCALLERDGLPPSGPVHLGFDITKVPWYGNVETDEEDAPTDEEWRIKSDAKDNTTWYWALGVLSITAPDRNYVLGFEPVSDQKEYDQVLDTMLDRVSDRLDLTFGRIYLDSGLANTKIMDICDEHGLNWLIQAERSGRREELVEKLPPGTPGGQKGVEFGSDDPREINIFACPDHPETVKAQETDPDDEETETATLTEYTGEGEADSGSDREEASAGTNGDETESDEEETDAEYAESQSIEIRDEIDVEDGGTWSVWNTNMDIEERDLQGLAYQYRHRWRVETAIRQLKQDFTGRCGADSPRSRALSLGAGQLFFNFWVALRRELPFHFDHTGVQATGLEVLHGLREADFEEAQPSRRL